MYIFLQFVQWTDPNLHILRDSISNHNGKSVIWKVPFICLDEYGNIVIHFKSTTWICCLRFKKKADNKGK